MAPAIVNPDEDPLEAVRRIFHYAYPGLLLLSFLIVGATHSIVSALRKEDVVATTVRGPGGKPLPVTKRKREEYGDDDTDGQQFGQASKAFFRASMVVATLTFFGTAVNVTARALYHRSVDGEHGWWCGEPKTVFILGSAFLYVYVSITLWDWPTSPYLVHIVFWSIALILDMVIFVCDFQILSGPHHVMTNLGRNKFTIETGPNNWDKVDLGFSACRLILLIGLVIVYLGVIWVGSQTHNEDYDDDYQSDADENTPLLDSAGHNGYHANGHSGTNGNGNGNGNGTANGTTNGVVEVNAPTVDAEAAFYRPEKLPHTTWVEYLRGYSIFFPYMWPSAELKLQLTVVFCFVLLVLQRIINIAVPWQIGKVVSQLAGEHMEAGQTFRMPWVALSLLMVFKTLQGPSGLLGSIRSLLWIPVSQHTYRALTTSAFEHVHSLSLDFHLGKRTGEVLSALNKGASVNSFLEQVTFQVFPMLIDLFAAIGFFYVEFGPTYAALTSIITFFYLFLTMRMAQNTADQRRNMSNADREEEAVKNDSIISYETVKYFNAEAFEFNRYRGAIRNFQAAEAKVTWSIALMNMCQSLVFMTGMLVAMMLGAYQVSLGTRRVGDFVTLMTLLGQLQGPLNFFGTFYRTVQQSMISGERLLELFKQRPTVVDRRGATEVTHCDGHVEFSKVEFAYDQRRPALTKLSFECPPGTTTALVGESGGGKSTLFRLMYRYFNCQRGTIKIDGQDVKDVTIDSIRRYIGVVPQDTILFNDTLMYNLKYANQNATAEDVYAACQAASIHDRIMSFPDGYYTKVGERGLRLSGGEKQRVAIARTLLKNPKIIMLDEATSALDSHTEQEIQSRLAKIGEGRTMMIIAHRLSTITHADQILVLKNGTIVEKGTHQSLVDRPNSVYGRMWKKQAKAEDAAVAARNAISKATYLLRKANLGGTESSTSTKIRKDGRTTPCDDASSSSDESAKALCDLGTTPPRLSLKDEATAPP
ncbi:uncharacterized protein BCR38DRAFT_344775 [Pseudomassariella vexata]|uniref:Heavy metal tolerance protein n=1 Tax=Pseudomassariella vexata TaxID=1141098 RepID=A0A1Y2DW89_9PEZI|nr:uncharacterized protein BCR38DRAFT_344775 [Pseudomassariella vexata]ORY63517.1 hypothetical protein BCR38DRAFT_344775 [Pseudomassariella vexata]